MKSKKIIQQKEFLYAYACIWFFWTGIHMNFDWISIEFRIKIKTTELLLNAIVCERRLN